MVGLRRRCAGPKAGVEVVVLLLVAGVDDLRAVGELEGAGAADCVFVAGAGLDLVSLGWIR